MVKLKDVADVAGVTIATVSMALSGKGRVSYSTRDRILRIASEMNYRGIDHSPVQRECPVDIGLIIADNQHFILHDFLDFAETYHLTQQVVHLFNGPDMKLPSLLTQAKGILHSGYVGEPLRSYLKQHPELPFVAIDDDTEYSVKTDFTAGVQRAMQYLLALGHRKIAFYEGSRIYAAPRIYNQEIAKCFQEYDVDHDPRFAPHPLSGSNEEEYMDASLKWAYPLIHSENRPTAFFCSGMSTARAVIYLAMEAGLRIPEDISVLAPGRMEDAICAYPYVTYISENFPVMATYALTMLQRRISNLHIPEKNILVDTKFVVMNTTGKYKGGK